MAIRNCIRCKSLFNYISGEPLCPKCKEKEKEEFEKVRKYLRKYPKSTMVQTSEETEVSVKVITKFLREGRLEISDDSPIGINCERCGKRINSGRYCEECAKELERGFSKGLKKEKNTVNLLSQKKATRMHYLNKNNVGKQ